MGKNLDTIIKNPIAQNLRSGAFNKRVVKPKKGKGSYSRKGKHFNKGGMIPELAEGVTPPLYREGGGKIGWLDYLFGYGKEIKPGHPDYERVSGRVKGPGPVVNKRANQGMRQKKMSNGVLVYADTGEPVAAYKKGGGLLKLGDEQADLAKANLDRIRKSGGPKTIEMQRREWLDANKHKRGAQMPAHLRDKPSLDDLKEPLDVATDFIPVVGEAKDFARAGADVAAGNYGSAALNTAAGVAGVVPGIGDAAAAGLRTVGRNLKSAAKPHNFHGWERASQRVPHLVKNQDDWNSVNTMAQRGENIEIGNITRRDRDKKGGSKDTRPGQEGRNAAVTLPDGRQVPVVVVPHKDPNKKWHVITVRDQGRDGKQTGVLGGREYNEGGPVKKGRSGNTPGSARAWWNYVFKNNNLRK